jgi:hypothetical protein
MPCRISVAKLVSPLKRKTLRRYKYALRGLFRLSVANPEVQDHGVQNLKHFELKKA